MKKKLLIILLAFFVILSFNATFASEHGNETLMLHESALELSVEETPTEILTADEEIGSFKDLKDDITRTPTGGELKLERDYEYNPTTDTESVGIYTSVLINKQVTIDGQGHSLDGKNSKTIFAISSTSHITLKNIIFKNGYATGNGGAITAGGAHNLKLINCTFINCIAPTHGGAVFMSQCNDVTITSCNFLNNGANVTIATRGGAIYWVHSKGGTLNDCNFTANNAHYGGAVYIDESNGISQYDNHYRDNFATNFGGDIFCSDNEAVFHDCDFTNSHAFNYGGSIYWKGSNSVMYNLQFVNVSANSYAGAIYFTNGRNMTLKKSSFRMYESKSAGALFFASPNCTVIDCDFEDGTANLGGSIYITAKGTTIKDSTFKNHTASESGGTVYVYGDDALIDNCTFELSSVPNKNNGGIIFIAPYTTNTNIINSEFKLGFANNGGAVYAGGPNAVIFNNEFVQNNANNLGGAVYLGGKDSMILANNFSHNNAYYGGAFYSVGANAQLSDNIYTNNYAYNQGGAIYLRGNTALLDKETFIDNVAANYAGAILLDSANSQINNSYFRGNNATYGSAIFKGSSVAYINNPQFVYNQAQSTSLDVTRNGNVFTVTFKAKDNILNAIWNNGYPSSIFIDGLNPKASVEESNNGADVYQDTREFDQIIVVNLFDKNDNLIETKTLKTDIYGQITYEAKGGHHVEFSHPNDVFYTEIANRALVLDFEIEKIAVNPVVINNTQIEFQIIVTNTGGIDLTDVRILEKSFGGLIYAGWKESDLWAYAGNVWMLNYPLAEGESAVLTVYFNTTDVGEFTNVALAAVNDEIIKESSAIVGVIPDNFEVKKVSLMPVTKIGDQTIFEIIVHNTGEDEIHNVFIIEDSYDGLIYSHTLEDALWDYTTTQDGKHKWTLKQALPGHEVLGIFVVFNTTALGNYTNYAIVGHEGVNKTVNATVCVNETVHEPEIPNPQLNISIFTVHPVIMVDGEVWFEITVENIGNIALDSVTIEEFEHENLIFSGFEIDSPLWDYKPKTLSNPNRPGILAAPIENNHAWTVNVPLLQNEVLGFFVKFIPTQTGIHSNTVLGHSEQTPDPLFATDNVLVLMEEHSIEKIAVTPTVNVGEQVTFKIIVHNTGDVVIESLVIHENPDESLIFDHGVDTSGKWGQDGDNVWYLEGTIAPGESAEFLVVYNTTKAGNITNTIGVEDKLYNATVEVTNKTENETVPENESVPNEDEQINDEPADNNQDNDDNGGEKPIDKEESNSKDTNHERLTQSTDKYATGNPILALLVVLISLVLIRRRE